MKCYPSHLTLLFLILSVCSMQPLSAQFLNWDYQDIHTDLRQSGARPDVVLDDLGQFHTVYWHQDRNQLVYGTQGPDGQWQWLDVPDVGTFGYASSLTVDDNQVVHIAYLHNDGGEATLKYAAFDNGLWTIESVLPGTFVGPYGPDLIFPTYIQPSLDIFMQDNGKPAILFFNGDYGNIVTCSQVISIYTAYELNLNVVLQIDANNWVNTPQADVPYTGGLVCINGSDRFGEFCQVLEQSDGDRYATAVNLHNHELMLYKANATDLSDWSYQILDTTARLQVIEERHFRETFNFPVAAMSADTTVHMAYSIANHYGQANSQTNRQPFVYARFNPDSIGQSGYSPYFETFPALNEFRTFFSVAPVNYDTVFIGYYHPESSSVVVLETQNGGQSWLPDTILSLNVTARLQSYVRGDSLHLFMFDEDRKQLLQSSRSLDMPAWNHRYITRTESSGDYLSSIVYREGANDQVYIAYSEKGNDQLRFAERINNTWSFEDVDLAGRQISDISLARDADGVPVIAYVFQDLERLKLADKRSGTWQVQTLDGTSKARDLQIGITADSLHIFFYDVSIGALKHLHGAYPDGPFQIDTLDNSSAIIGQRPSLIIDSLDQLHVAYLDVLNTKVRYAFRNTNGLWFIQDATEAQNYSPSSVSLALEADGTPVIAFRNSASNDLQYARRQGSLWTVTPVEAEMANIVGQPLKLLLDSQDRPWILYNYTAVLDELRLVRRTNAGAWAQVSVLNPQEIANVFDFSLVGEDLYVVGRKNVVGATGLGLLFAQQGIKTDLNPLLNETAFSLYPNPGREHLTIEVQANRGATDLSLYNLQGQALHHWNVGERHGATTLQWSTEGLSPGIYFFRLETSQGTQLRRWVRMP